MNLFRQVTFSRINALLEVYSNKHMAHEFVRIYVII